MLVGEGLNGRPIMYTDARQQEKDFLDQLKVIFGIICLRSKDGILI